MALVLGTEELTELLAEIFPQVAADFRIEELSENHIQMRLLVQDRHLRPGGTVSGPSLFALADVALYAMLMARVGPKALAVTTSASIDFMRKPAAGQDVLADCKLLKLGRVLVVGDVLMRSEGSDKVVARASMTYSIPPE
ncbi:MAG: PaaI family thioesterase [Marinibacterium sp.]|nr:PaaI family thioesterase [Marinibacterium sp.]